MINNKDKRVSILLFLMMVFFLLFSIAWNSIRRLQSYFVSGFSFIESMLVMIICAFSIFLVLLLIIEEN